MTSPYPNDPGSGPTGRPADQPIYIDPVTHQQLYMDPLTGQLHYDPVGYAQMPTGVTPPAAPAQAPQYPYGPYPQYPYGPGPYPARRSTNGFAIASLVLSICAVLGVFCYGLGALFGVVGAILGHMARARIRETGEQGGGMALAGIIMGWVGTGLGILFAVALFAL